MLTHSLCVGICGSFVALKSILFIYLFLIASVKQNRPLHQEPGQIIATSKSFCGLLIQPPVVGTLTKPSCECECMRSVCSSDFANLSD